MPAVMNSGVRVHYEIEGSGPPLILQHGWTGSLDYWRDFGYCQPLRNTHQLILIDARGHGQSSIPQRDEDYTMQLMARARRSRLVGTRTREVFRLLNGRLGWISPWHWKPAPVRLNDYWRCSPLCRRFKRPSPDCRPRRLRHRRLLGGCRRTPKRWGTGPAGPFSKFATESRSSE
jgi:hypothetical protein